MSTDQINSNTDWGAIYAVGVLLTGILTFICIWIYAMSEWGFLLGIMFGWIPSLITAVIGGFIWPLLALIVVALILFSL